MDYLDFDIDVEAGKSGDYDVSVVQSPAGEAREQMSLPFDNLALQNRIQALQIALLRAGTSRRSAAADDKSVQQLGSDLYAALFAGEVSSRLDVSRNIAKRDGKGLRIRLRFAEAELAGLPWEYLYDAQTADYLALGASTPVIRYIPVAQPIMPLEVEPPLRILAMTAGPSDLGQLDVDRERQRLETALASLISRGLVELHWVEGEKWEDLQQALWQPPWHIFHFVGHGGYSERRNSGVIYVTGDDGRARELSARDLAVLLGDHEPLRLALLNSCETAQGAKTDIFSSTAAALVRRGTPAVVAMQFEITDDAAIQFSRSFYAAVAHGMPVDSAVAEARKSVALRVANSYEWGTPVLFMRSPDGRLFDIPEAAAEPPAAMPPPDEGVPAAVLADTPDGAPALASPPDQGPPSATPPSQVPPPPPPAPPGGRGPDPELLKKAGIAAVVGVALLALVALASGVIPGPSSTDSPPDPTSSDGPSPTPTAIATPTVTASLDENTPPPVYHGSVKPMPNSAPIGSLITIDVTGFPPNTMVFVKWNSGTPIAQGTTDDGGTFTTQYRVTRLRAGLKTIVAVANEGLSNQTLAAAAFQALDATPEPGSTPAASATIVVVTTVVNDSGQTRVASDFSQHLASEGSSVLDFAGATSPGVTLTVNPGHFEVSQDAVLFYTTSLSADCIGDISADELKTCTITNDDWLRPILPFPIQTLPLPPVIQP